MDSELMPIGSTLGILGGGQLGRMMALAARVLGIRTMVWDPQPESPAFLVADHHLSEPYDSEAAWDAFVSRVDRVTYEFENINWRLAQRIAEEKPVFPSFDILRICQERLREKDAARAFGLATTPYRRVQTAQDLLDAAKDLGTPGVLKTVSGGYDGKGQVVIGNAAEAIAVGQQLEASRVYIYEKWVAFTREVSVVVARDVHGNLVTYPATENHHHRGILDYSVVPAGVSEKERAALESAARQLASGLELVGVMALEFFVTDQGEILFNEMAPRPHNSGHWTIDAAWPSQFMQHVRAVAGWPVLTPRWWSPVVMVNLLGDLFLDGDWSRLTRVAAMDGVQLHWYEKREMRPGRKVGHVTILADSRDRALAEARRIKEMLGGQWHDGA
ncbi:MAG: 5-(carboxyamino)imidazole ribonucleotide synthase [Firmicutes bacterium]|nr:5-(carboxyamino)imidazole ribonucleotide synthase [Bacillota bacterium]